MPIERADVRPVIGRFLMHHPFLQVGNLALLPNEDAGQKKQQQKKRALRFLFPKRNRASSFHLINLHPAIPNGLL